MFNLATKVLFSVSAAALGLALGYGLAVGERSGVALLLFLAVAAFAAALATALVPDVAPTVRADAPPPERRSATTGAPARDSGWPLAAAAALTLLAAGAAIGPGVVIAGVLAVLVATAGWFGQVWREHPSWTPRVRERVSYRLLVPVGLPVATVLLVAVIAVSLSRVLLAIPKDAAVLVAMVVAIAILAACAWVASRPRLGSSALVALAALAGVSMVGAGIAGAVSGERHFEVHEHEENQFRLSARNTQFSRSTLSMPANEKVVLEFENADDDVYHNVAVYEGEGPTAKPVFNGEGFPGDDQRTYHLTTPPPGRYVFICDFHPTMKGTLITEAH
ncbi:MAG: cupredoxin domain-containing protein [Actinomycetota bacterium]|nr:cupredoxin domain-containing protein [Actinomycetota bacterium]